MKKANSILKSLREQIAAGKNLNGKMLSWKKTEMLSSLEADFFCVCYGNNNKDGNFDPVSSYLPYDNANDLVLNSKINSSDEKKLVIAGVCATDPFIYYPIFIENIIKSGYNGVINFPSVCITDGNFRKIIEDKGIGYTNEVNFIKSCSIRNIFTIACVSSENEAKRMIEAGAHAILVLVLSEFSNGIDYIEKYASLYRSIYELAKGKCLCFAMQTKNINARKMAYYLHHPEGIVVL